MNKRTLLFGFVCSAAPQIAHTTPELYTVVPHASYVVYDGHSRISGGIPVGSTKATFYTYDGNPLQTIEHQQRFDIMRRKIDSRAPKPQPAFCGVISWSGTCAGNEAGDYLRFFDKNYCAIGTYRYNRETGTLTTVASGHPNTFHFRTLEELKHLGTFPLDVSAINEISEVHARGW